MTVVFKGVFSDQANAGGSDDQTVTIPFNTGTLYANINTGTTSGSSVAAGDLAIVTIANKFAGTGRSTFADLLSYDSGLEYLWSGYQAPTADSLTIHIFYRWCTGSETDRDIHIDTNPSNGWAASTFLFSGLRGSGNPFSDMGPTSFYRTPDGSPVANGGTWDPSTTGVPSLTVPNNNGAVALAIACTFDDDGTPGIALNTARSFTYLNHHRTQLNVNLGEWSPSYRILSQADAGSSIQPPEFIQTTGSSEHMGLVFFAAAYAGSERTVGYRYDLMRLSSEPKLGAGGGVGAIGAASGGASVGGTVPPPPTDYTAAPSYPADVLTTKGDLLTFDTAVNRLAVGTDGHVLTADSAQAKGVKWAAAAASVSAIDDLSDVDTSTSSPSVGDYLTWDGSNWVPIGPLLISDAGELLTNEDVDDWIYGD